MKISKFPEWIGDNVFGICVTLVIGFLIVMMVSSLSSKSVAEEKFPVGTDVSIKNTHIKGTVTYCFGDNVRVSFVEPNGDVKHVDYNYNLVQKQ